MNGAETIQTTPLPDGTMLAPQGDVDLARSPTLRQAIADASKARPRRLVIDLARVAYMDSSGVATLVEALQVARRNGTSLVLAGLQPRVRSIMEIARLDTVFTIVADADAARSA